jgi:hypothetical protein
MLFLEWRVVAASTKAVLNRIRWALQHPRGLVAIAGEVQTQRVEEFPRLITREPRLNPRYNTVAFRSHPREPVRMFCTRL